MSRAVSSLRYVVSRPRFIAHATQSALFVECGSGSVSSKRNDATSVQSDRP